MASEKSQSDVALNVLDRGEVSDFSPTGSLFPSVSSTQVQDQHADDHQSKTTVRSERVGNAVKKFFHINQSNKHNEHATSLAPAPPVGDQDTRLDGSIGNHEKPSLKEVLHKPIDAIQSVVQSEGGSQVSGRLIAKEISHGHEVKLVHALDAQAIATTDEEKADADEKMDELIKMRHAMYIRWTMDRHVQCVRRVSIAPTIRLSRADFTSTNSAGKKKTDWMKYGSYLLQKFTPQLDRAYIGSTPKSFPVTQETLQSSSERLLVGSAALQAIAMQARRVYRWEDRQQTLLCLVVYASLWYSNLLLGGMFLGLVWLVVQRRLQPPNLEDLRRDLEKIEDASKTAHTLTSQVDKYGEKDWVDELVKELGPWGLTQLGRIADNLEVLQNFYEWRDPYRTAQALTFHTLGAVIVAFTPTWLLVKTTSLLLGTIYFGFHPISIRYPENRLIALPFRCFFWNVPTHSEWAISCLQSEGSDRRQSIAEQKSSLLDRVPPDHAPRLDTVAKQPAPVHDDIVESLHVAQNTQEPHSPTHLDSSSVSERSKQDHSTVDYSSYTCISQKHSGKLFISSNGVRFKPSLVSSKEWDVDYDSLKYILKTNREVKIGPAEEGLEFVTMDQKYKCINIKSRDEVFTQIIGFSARRWEATQVL